MFKLELGWIIQHCSARTYVTFCFMFTSSAHIYTGTVAPSSGKRWHIGTTIVHCHLVHKLWTIATFSTCLHDVTVV